MTAVASFLGFVEGANDFIYNKFYGDPADEKLSMSKSEESSDYADSLESSPSSSSWTERDLRARTQSIDDVIGTSREKSIAGSSHESDEDFRYSSKDSPATSRKKVHREETDDSHDTSDDFYPFYESKKPSERTSHSIGRSSGRMSKETISDLSGAEERDDVDESPAPVRRKSSRGAKTDVKPPTAFTGITSRKNPKRSQAQSAPRAESSSKQRSAGSKPSRTSRSGPRSPRGNRHLSPGRRGAPQARRSNHHLRGIKPLKSLRQRLNNPCPPQEPSLAGSSLDLHPAMEIMGTETFSEHDQSREECDETINNLDKVIDEILVDSSRSDGESELEGSFISTTKPAVRQMSDFDLADADEASIPTLQLSAAFAYLESESGKSSLKSKNNSVAGEESSKSTAKSLSFADQGSTKSSPESHKNSVVDEKSVGSTAESQRNSIAQDKSVKSMPASRVNRVVDAESFKSMPLPLRSSLPVEETAFKETAKPSPKNVSAPDQDTAMPSSEKTSVPEQEANKPIVKSTPASRGKSIIADESVKSAVKSQGSAIAGEEAKESTVRSPQNSSGSWEAASSKKSKKEKRAKKGKSDGGKKKPGVALFGTEPVDKDRKEEARKRKLERKKQATTLFGDGAGPMFGKLRGRLARLNLEPGSKKKASRNETVASHRIEAE